MSKKSIESKSRSTSLRTMDRVEDFPKFMGNVEEVRQLDTSTSSGRPRLPDRAPLEGGDRRQKPNQVIAWRAITGDRDQGQGRVSADRRSNDVKLALDYERPPAIAGEVGDKLVQATPRSVEEDLKRFKHSRATAGADRQMVGQSSRARSGIAFGFPPRSGRLRRSAFFRFEPAGLLDYGSFPAPLRARP